MGAVAAPSDGCSLQQAVWEGGFGTRAAARRTTGSSPPVIGSFQSLSKGRPLTSQSRRVAPSNDRDEPSDLPCLDAAMLGHSQGEQRQPWTPRFAISATQFRTFGWSHALYNNGMPVLQPRARLHRFINNSIVQDKTVDTGAETMYLQSTSTSWDPQVTV